MNELDVMKSLFGTCITMCKSGKDRTGIGLWYYKEYE